VGRDREPWGRTVSGGEGQGAVGRDSEKWEVGSSGEGHEMVGRDRERWGRTWRGVEG